MDLRSAGTDLDTTVNSGSWIRYFGGVAKNTTVAYGGILNITGVHSGTLCIAEGATVSANSKAVIDFTVAEQEDRAVALINHLDWIQGVENANFTITVRNEQENGEYLLAEDASRFNTSSTVLVKQETENVLLFWT